MFKRFLSHFLIGNAKLDLVLDRDTYRMGETATGKVHIEAGMDGDTIKELNVEFRVKSNYYDRHERQIVVDELVAKVEWDREFSLQDGEKVELDFQMKIPEFLPVSSLNTRYYLKTNLDVAEGRDPKDTDSITVLPSGLLRNFLEGFERLGCKVIAESYFGRKGNQGIYFRNTTWMTGLLDELEFTFNPFNTSREIKVFYEVEKKTHDARIDRLDLNEKKGYHTFTAADLATVEKAAESIKHFVETEYRRLP
jgi:sporulation-control protein